MSSYRTPLATDSRESTIAALRERRWTRKEYYALYDAGILTDDDRVQLIEGELVFISGPNPPHVASLLLLMKVLEKAFTGNVHLRPQAPVFLSDISEPQPDLAVVTGSIRDYLPEHPTTALLVVEVSDTTIWFDRGTKARLYARSGIQDYWIINLVDPCVEVHREPTCVDGSWAYRNVQCYVRGECIAPLAAPDARIPIVDILP